MSYFENPKQVLFFDPGINEYVDGIAYKDKIICLHCGAAFSIDDILESTPEKKSSFFVKNYWKDLSLL